MGMNTTRVEYKILYKLGKHNANVDALTKMESVNPEHIAPTRICKTPFLTLGNGHDCCHHLLWDVVQTTP